MINKLELYYIENIEQFTEKLDIDSQFFNDIMNSWDEEEKSIKWSFNPDIDDYDLRCHGVEINIKEEDDIPQYDWGVELRGDSEDISISLTDEYIGDSEISDDCYDFIKRQFKDNLPAIN